MKRLIEAFAVAAVLLVIVGVPTGVLAYDGFLHGHQDAREIVLVGQDSSWSPAVIEVRQGERIRLRLTSRDVVHGFALPGYGAMTTDIYPGRYVTFEFTADQPGTFPFACLVTCGLNHNHMQGKLIVDPVGAAPAGGSQQ